MDDIFSILSFLPFEIINMILPYTYEAQSKALTNDIKNFYTTKAVASQLYYNRFVMGFEEPEPSDKDWFINDLFFFSNQFIPTMHGYGISLFKSFLSRKHYCGLNLKMNDNNSDHEYDECSFSFIQNDSLKPARKVFDEEIVLDDDSADELDKDYLPSAELIAQRLQDYKITFVDLLKAFLSATDEDYTSDVSMMIAEGKVGGKICAIKKEVVK